MVERTAVNPWTWSVNFGFNQGELVESPSKVLFCAGQTSVDGDGAPQHPGDMAAQIASRWTTSRRCFGEAGMTLANLVRLNFYTVDVDAYLANAGVAGAAPCRRGSGAGRHPARRRPPRLPGAPHRDRRHRGGVTHPQLASVDGSISRLLTQVQFLRLGTEAGRLRAMWAPMSARTN